MSRPDQVRVTLRGAARVAAGPVLSRTAGATLLTMAIAAGCLGAVGLAHIGRWAWTDEAWVVRFARQASVAEALQRPVSEQQPVAPAYLLLLHALARVDGEHLWVYRLPSLASGLALLWTAGWLAGRCCGRLALGMAAALALLLSPLLQRYVTEIKQYLPDAALTLVLIALGDQWCRTRGRSWAAAWLLVALLTLVFSFAGWFAVAGTGVVMALGVVRRGERVELAAAAAIGVLMASCAAAAHLLYIRPIAANGMLRAYWVDQFLPHDRHVAARLLEFAKDLFAGAWHLYAAPSGLMLVVAVAGWAAWWRRCPVAAGMATSTAAATLAANLVGLWPMGVRINLPMVVLAHLGLLNGALSLAGGLGARGPAPADLASQGSGGPGPMRPSHPAPVRLEWFGGVAMPPLLALAIAGLIGRETRQADFEVADFGTLFAQIDGRRGRDELVLLDATTWLNHQCGGSVAAPTAPMPWPDPRRAAEILDPLLARAGRGGLLLAIGHHNEYHAAVMDQFARAGSSRGSLERAWSGRMVALYRFHPQAAVKAEGPAR